ncbi:MAG TPA: hypothetical protein VJJ98_04100 [Sedimentisphaerales bacterium]|nr:hypothetical protein [Sedimentisphaerales bacterium]
MRTVKISDELYEELKGFVVDPFDDTAEVVIGRLVQIANKAKDKWPALEGSETRGRREATMADHTRMSYEEAQDADQPAVLL